MPTLSYDWNQVSALRRARMEDAETYAKGINHGAGFMTGCTLAKV